MTQQEQEIYGNLLIQHSRTGNLQMVNMLIAKGININTAYTKIDKGTALHYSHNRLVVQTLLKAGANPNTVDFYGRSPLHTAKTAWKVHALLEAGADPKYQDLAGHTAYEHQAKQPEHGHKLAILQLLSRFN